MHQSVQRSTPPEHYELTGPVSRLVLASPKGGLIQTKNMEGGSADNPRYYCCENQNLHLVISGWFELEERFSGTKNLWEGETKVWRQKGLPFRETTMKRTMSREIRLASRPHGFATASNSALARTELESPRDREVLIHNLFMSVAPYVRGRMNEGASYVLSFKIGRALDGSAVGAVTRRLAICGSGLGACVSANKAPAVRAALDHGRSSPPPRASRRAAAQR